MLLNQPNFIDLDAVPKLPRKVTAFSGGLRLGSTNKYFSTDFSKRIKELRKIETETGNTLESYKALSVSFSVFTNTFSRYKFSSDIIRLLKMIERSIQVKLRVSPIGFETYFDAVNREIKTRFYFINYNYMTDERAVTGELSNDTLLELTNSVQAKLGLFDNIDMSSDILNKVESEVVASYAPMPPENADAQSLAIFNVVSLLGDPAFVNATHKAMRSLDGKRAQELQAALNSLIDLNGDKFIEPLELPKKFKHQDKSIEALKKDDNLVDDASFLFT